MRQAAPYIKSVIADIGTGSGAIAVSLARELPRAEVYAVDVSKRALDIAALNCIRHNVRVGLLNGDLLAPLDQPVDMIVANLPYIPDAEIAGLSAEIREYEPGVALAGGEDGLDVVRRLIVDAPARDCPAWYMLRFFLRKWSDLHGFKSSCGAQKRGPGAYYAGDIWCWYAYRILDFRENNRSLHDRLENDMVDSCRFFYPDFPSFRGLHSVPCLRI